MKTAILQCPDGFRKVVEDIPNATKICTLIQTESHRLDENICKVVYTEAAFAYTGDIDMDTGQRIFNRVF